MLAGGLDAILTPMPSTRFAFRTTLVTRPFVWGLGLVPQLAYADLDDERLHVRLGPWLSLEAPRASIAWVDLARGDLPVAPVHASQTPGTSSLQVVTARGPLARIRFTETQRARLPIGPPRFRPEFAPLVIGPTFGVDQIALSLVDPEGFIHAVGADTASPSTP